jgi:hypothetical protein
MSRVKRVHRKTNRNRLHGKLPKQRILAPRTAKEYFAKPGAFQDRWNRVAHVITTMRTEGISLSRAARQFEVDRRHVVKLAKSALRKRKNGRYAAKSSDKLLRILAVPTAQGVQELATRDSKQASVLGKYWSVIQRYLQTGDDSALRDFKGKSIIDESHQKRFLMTDLGELDRLGSAGVFSFESLYARSA